MFVLSQETQLRFTPAVRRGKLGDNPSEVDMILYDIKSFDQQVEDAVWRPSTHNIDS